MSHRIVWPVVAALSLAGVIAWLSQSSAQRAERGAPTGTVGRYVVAHTSVDVGGNVTVLMLDTMTGQLYRAGEKDFKSVSELPGAGRPGGRDGRPPVRDARPEPKLDKDGRPRDARRSPPKGAEDPPAPRPDRVKDAPPPQREEK